MFISETWLIIYISCVLFMFGAVFGSFINCVAGRIVAGKDWIRGRSYCGSCGHELSALDLVPILSYIFLGGKCRYCHTHISARYMLTELLLGTLFVWRFLVFKTVDFLMFRDLILFVLLLGLSLVDLDSYIIPDGFIVAGIINWLISIIFVENKLSYFIKGITGGLFIGGGILVLSLIMDKILGKESLGGGDVKLLFMVCLYTGPYIGLFLLFLSCVIGLLFVLLLKKGKIPFGPSISMAAFVAALYGEVILRWYLSLF
ncbi:MAG: prepilin peptidase [Erysipelotrichaceae bacterium]|nr:prepilin peptidase [Erysipelotrichaceae bacterium]